MPGYVQQDGKLYIASAACVASEVVTTANQVAELNGNVVVETTWTKAMARWRTRAIKDIQAYQIDANISVEELEFRASAIAKMFTGVGTGSCILYGRAGATNTTALFWTVKTSTAPVNKQFLFEFVRTDTNKVMQIWAPRVQCDNWPTPFNVDGFTLQNLTFQLMASTNGNLIRYVIQS